MREGRKTDQLVHEVVFKQKLDIAPQYSKDFQHAALLWEMLFVDSGAAEMCMGYDDSVKRYYAEICIETDQEDLKIRKYETTHTLAICSLAMSYFGKKECQSTS